MKLAGGNALAYGVAFGRIAFGTVSTIAPGFAMNVWLAADPHSPPVKAMGMAVGARDLVLGIGTVQALNGRGDPAPWLKWAALADAADGIGTFRAFRDDLLNPRALIGVVAVGFSALSWTLGRKEQLERGPG